jgi:hypothetical protein
LRLLQRVEDDGAPLLPTVTGARVLVALADLAAGLDEQRDTVTEALEDAPGDVLHADGAAKAER